MKKRPIIICLAVAILGAILFWLESNCIISGWLKGEAFYQGRPTSYWRRHVQNRNFIVDHQGRLLGKPSSSGWLEGVIGRSEWGVLWEHPLWIGDPAAREVLTELTVDSTDSVREFALEALARIKQ